MTKGEYLQNRIDCCTKNAVDAMKKQDIDMVQFYLNARNGFIRKRQILTLEELKENI